ncbi:MAG TPA: metallophosphoesterase [Chitinophagaceae bacterium]|nr:metallophosphoesterase [Chitinophagaceae bacterium]
MQYLLTFICSGFLLFAHAQALPPTAATSPLLEFVSDTQEPMGVERIRLAATQNKRATAMIYAAIVQDKPTAVFMLGDVVSLGYKQKKWGRTDVFLDSARKENISVYGLMGNHDVMFRERRGEKNFNRRFPEHRYTGYLKVVDSIAVMMMNSNFAKLSPAENLQQQEWYKKTMDSLTAAPAIKAIIVSCHHPAFTNSTIVKPSDGVRRQFVPAFLASAKAVLFITGHAHAFEHFVYNKKNFLVIGGGGGLHQPLSTKAAMPEDKALAYKPYFHYLQLRRYGNNLQLQSRGLQTDFSGFFNGYSFAIALP